MAGNTRWIWLYVVLKVKVIQIYSDRNILCVLEMALDRLRDILLLIITIITVVDVAVGADGETWSWNSL